MYGIILFRQLCFIQSYNNDYYYYYFTILGSKDEVERYLSEVYTPDFFKELCPSDESDEVNDKNDSEVNDNAADDCTNDEKRMQHLMFLEKEPSQIVCLSYL